MSHKILSLNDKPLSIETNVPDAHKLIEGPATQTTESHYEGANGRFFTGYWSSQIGAWHIDCTGDEEYCHLLEGVVELVDEDGAVQRFSAGDEFIIPEGFKGIWRTVEPCRKRYVIAVV